MSKIAVMAALLSLAQPTRADVATAQMRKLGLELARQGTLATLLPMVAQKEIEELIADHPELSDAERKTLRKNAVAISDASIERVVQSQADIYAEKLSAEQLQKLIKHNRSEAAMSAHSLMPHIIGASMKAMESVDFKAQVRAALCTQTGKLCEPGQ